MVALAPPEEGDCARGLPPLLTRLPLRERGFFTRLLLRALCEGGVIPPSLSFATCTSSNAHSELNHRDMSVCCDKKLSSPEGRAATWKIGCITSAS